ncbi:MAG: hypothetical protein H0V30_12655 [Chitinophagaceae bacterium]|nr:hypothetical protein [Chitinophagaceae bacterium]
MKERMGVYRVHSSGVWSGLTAVDAYYKTLPIVAGLFDNLGPEHHNDVRIYFMNLLEQAIAEDAETISNCDKTKSLLGKMGFPVGICTAYLCALIKKKENPADLARMIPKRILRRALGEKRKNLRPLI